MPETPKSCPSCGRGNGQDALFCSQCGHRFETPKRFNGVSESRRQCAVCGRTLGSFEIHCSACASGQGTPTASQIGGILTQSPTPSSNAASVRQYPANPVPQAPVNFTPPPAYYAPPVQPLANPHPHVQCGGCGQWIPQGSTQCQFCGATLQPSGFGSSSVAYTNPTVQDNRAPVQQVFINTTPGGMAPVSPPQYALTPYRTKKDKTSAGILALLLGGFGAHHFYLGNTTAGILSILFFWTYIPALVGMIQGIMYLCMGEEEFQRRYGKTG